MAGKPTKEALLAAKAVAEGRLSQRNATAYYGVSRGTLRRHLRALGVADMRTTTAKLARAAEKARKEAAVPKCRECGEARQPLDSAGFCGPCVQRSIYSIIQGRR